MAIYPGEEPLTPTEDGRLKRFLKRSRKFRSITSAVLKPMDVILDSLGGLPGVGAIAEIKDGTAAVLDFASDRDDGKLDG